MHFYSPRSLKVAIYAPGGTWSLGTTQASIYLAFMQLKTCFQPYLLLHGFFSLLSSPNSNSGCTLLARPKYSTVLCIQLHVLVQVLEVYHAVSAHCTKQFLQSGPS